MSSISASFNAPSRQRIAFSPASGPACQPLHQRVTSPDAFGPSTTIPKLRFGRQFAYTGPFAGLNFFTDFNDGVSNAEALHHFNDTLDFLAQHQTSVVKHLALFKKTGHSAPADYLDRIPARMDAFWDKPARLHQQMLHFLEGRSLNLDIHSFQDIPSGDTAYANLALQRLAGRKNNEIHVHVVDPGVGATTGKNGHSEHDRSILITKEHGVIIGPNNSSLGLLEKTLKAQGEEPELLSINLEAVQELERLRRRNPKYTIPATFHARDVFSIVAAAIASGIDPHLLGDKTPRTEIRQNAFSQKLHQMPFTKGQSQTFQAVRDHTFGNLKTNLVLSQQQANALEAHGIRFKISVPGSDTTLIAPFKSFFSQVDSGQPLVYLGSTQASNPRQRFVELALNRQNISEHLNVQPGEMKSLSIERVS